jgi:hypothetical protein
MTRILLALWLASLAQAGAGQTLASLSGCGHLFPTRTDGPSDAEAARIAERWLIVWYPTRAKFDEARAGKMREKTACIERAHAEVAELERERREFESTLNSYSGRPLPPSVRAYLDASSGALAVARKHELQQATDLVRLHEIYEAQLKRLQSRPNWQ